MPSAVAVYAWYHVSDPKPPIPMSHSFRCAPHTSKIASGSTAGLVVARSTAPSANTCVVTSTALLPLIGESEPVESGFAHHLAE
jgi:hypothetical protein